MVKLHSRQAVGATYALWEEGACSSITAAVSAARVTATAQNCPFTALHEPRTVPLTRSKAT